MKYLLCLVAFPIGNVVAMPWHRQASRQHHDHYYSQAQVISPEVCAADLTIPFDFDGDRAGATISSERIGSLVQSASSRSVSDDVPFHTGIMPLSIAPTRAITTSVAASVSVLITPTTVGSAYGMAQVLPFASTQAPFTQAIINSALDTRGQVTQEPLIDIPITQPISILSPAVVRGSLVTSPELHMASADVFQPLATDAPPNVIPIRPDHPVQRLGIQSQTHPLSTNKFYANFFLGSQTAGTWTHPYSVAWATGGGQSGSWGMSIAHIDADQRVFGPNPNANPAEYFINPNGLQSIILSAAELDHTTTISVDSLSAFSANINLLHGAQQTVAITFPLVQGMGFVTAVYHSGTPVLQSIVLFRSLTKLTTSPKPGVTKFSITLEDGKIWFIYASSRSGAPLNFVVVNNGLIQATSSFDGIIQIAKSPTSNPLAEAMYDAACGAFPIGVTLSGTASGATGTYTLSFTKAGMSNTTLAMFALPHHIASLSPETALAVTSVQLTSTTKGIATAIVADSWTMIESLPTTLSFGPWSTTFGNNFGSFSRYTTLTIHAVASTEVSQNMSSQTNLNSMYYSGKALAKFAGIIYTLHDLLGDVPLALTGLDTLKACFALFTSNRNQYPLVYESAWGGLVSSATYTTGDSGADFGNTYYNDHHFHYGYFILAASIIAYLDPSWLTIENGLNKNYINAMVRDIANPSPLDPYFPVSRMFDWYHGHSWAHGLYETFDGKDEESSSEDAMSAYALKMWGHVTGDANLEARGNLQLAITARSLQSYFLYDSSNTIQPSQFIGNKVSGIMFENKIDHTTYFGAKPEFVQGIHMLPLLPSSAYTRKQRFVQEEWDTYFSNGRVDAVEGGWRGILYANLALIDPVAAWNFFNDSNFDASLLDGGASRTWYLAMAAAFGGAPS